MILDFLSGAKSLQQGWQRLCGKQSVKTSPAVSRAARPKLNHLAGPDADLPPFVRNCPVTMRYIKLLGALGWDRFPERDERRAWPGPPPDPRAAFAAAYLVKIDQQLRYMPDLRRFLVEHPGLIWACGFRLQPAAQYLCGFDPDASLPTSKHFSQVLREMTNGSLQILLDSTVEQIAAVLPDGVSFGEAVEGDTKHIIAWVKENNPKAYLKDRYDKTKPPQADPDCRLGCKKRHNRPADDAHNGAAEPPPPSPNSTPPKSKSVGEFYWGYASGVSTTKVAGWCEVVLAELTQPFDQADVSYFFPLMAETERRLGRRPKYGIFDMGFDAFYVHQYFHDTGGAAIVPLAKRGGIHRQFSPEGLPLCQAGLPMPLRSTFICGTTLVEHERGRYGCPRQGSDQAEQTCPGQHKNWATGGCVVTMPTCDGARLRYQLDRESDWYKQLYKQRTADERINSQAKELGIERPYLRRGSAIANQNTLIYVLIDLRALHRCREKARALQAVTATAA